MNEILYDTLRNKNNAIISAFTDAVKGGYEEYIDLIAVTGSFATGDWHEYSDLDLLIVINDDKIRDLARCFILGDVGYDIYMVDWEYMQSVSTYSTPHVIKLLDVDMIYSSPEGPGRYDELRKELLRNMNDRSVRKKICSGHLSFLKKFITKLNEATSKKDILMNGAKAVIAAEYFIYTLNGEYVRHGIRSVPSEVRAMKILPEGFWEHYHKAINFSDEEELRSSVNELYHIIRRYSGEDITVTLPAQEEPPVRELIPPTKENLKGTYEEIWSNWKMKMLLAAETSDRYLSFMSSVSAQDFYDEMYHTFDIDNIDLISSYSPDDLYGNYTQFLDKMDEYLTNYKNAALEVNHIKDISGLKKLYTK